MNRRLEILPLFLLSLSLLPVVPACDPEYDLCVVATSCTDGQPIAGAHVRIQAYDLDGTASADGKLCTHGLNFPVPFEIEVDAPGFTARTEGPFQFDQPGTTSFQATVCLDLQP